MNDEFTKSLLESHGDLVATKLSAATDLTPEQSLQALSALSPLVLSSLKRKQAEVGAGGIEELLAQAGITEDQADNLDDVFEKGLAGHSSQTRAIFDDDAQDQTAQALSKKFNIGGALAKKLLPMLAPIILGMLLKKGGQGGRSGATQSGGSGLAGGIGSILDRDGDGSCLDDIAGMVLGGGGATQKRGGILQWILSLFFGRK
jgi:hypothetical protein